MAGGRVGMDSTDGATVTGSVLTPKKSFQDSQKLFASVSENFLVDVKIQLIFIIFKKKINISIINLLNDPTLCYFCAKLMY